VRGHVGTVGPGRGVYGRTQGGFVDTNYFLIDKLTCNDVFPEWAMTRFAGGTGGVVVDNIELEPGVRTGGGSVVTRHAGAGTHLQGVPAHPVTTMRRFGPTPRD